MNDLIEIIKEIHIKKYSQEEYREIVDDVFDSWKEKNYEAILNRSGWLDMGGSGQTNMIDIRLRTKISEDELKTKIGKMLSPEDYNVLVTKDTTVRFPNGKVGAIYLKQVIPEELADESYNVLHELKKHE